MADQHQYTAEGMTGPADDAASVTAGASALSYITRGLWIGGSGDVTVTMKNGQSVTFSSVPGGTILPIRVSHVTAATATNIIALW